MFLNSVPKGNKKGLDKGAKEQQQQVKNLPNGSGFLMT
jgi:hypothetical protein